jgi:N-glycosylase/DNA lyase
VALDQVSPAEWNWTNCDSIPLALTTTLTSGQAFRWRRDTSGIWWGTLGTTIMALWQHEGDPFAPLYWQTFPQQNQRETVEQYLRLDVPLDILYADWIRTEPRIVDAVQSFRGLRLLRQPPLECFFSFQCATCNTVIKIERSVHRLATRYGERLEPGLTSCRDSALSEVSDDGPPALLAPRGLQFQLYAFPDLDALAGADELDLRSDLWGYRAPRVIALARLLKARGDAWLANLRATSYSEAKSALVEMHGIGEKVADCICLFCLDKDEAVPVDTHVRRIACSLFVPELQDKSLTPRVYRAIAGAYQERFGAYAGWAQQYLFLGAMRRPKHEQAVKARKRLSR